MSVHYDLVVIGAGPGGYVAAIRAAQLGGKVALVERGNVGGTCLNVGCIPTKAWVHSALLLRQAKHAEDFGVLSSGVEFDFSRAVRNKDKVVTQLVRGVGGLVKANGIDLLQGTAQFIDANTLSVEGDQVTFDTAIVATGSFPTRPPIAGIDDSRCIDSTGMLALQEIPKRVVVLGGGVIGSEFASIFNTFGSEVTIVEMLPKLLGKEDVGASSALAKEFKARKIAIELDSRCDRIEGTASGVTVHFTGPKGAGSVEADIVLVSTGRAPLVDGLNLEAAGVRVRRAHGHWHRRAHAHQHREHLCDLATVPVNGSSHTRRAARARSQPRTPSVTIQSSTIRPCRESSTPIPRLPRSA